jgi:serine/threonine protein phosphatase PrpC
MMTRIPVRAMSNFSAQGPRPAQEDFVLTSGEKGIFVVADGFGGPIAGSEASKVACESVRDFLDREANDLEATLPFVLRSYYSLAGNVLFNALIYANQQLLKRNDGRNVHEKGGASVLAGFLDGDLLAIAAVGACSAWLIRGGKAVELVSPRTFGRLCDPFNPDPPMEQRVPLMAVGMSEDLEPEIFECRLKPGDWLLLHTDGLVPAVREILADVQGRNLPAGRATEEIEIALKGCPYPENVAATVAVF